ncbi:hypothetical protein N9Q26_00705 [bacterium]|nr:hypothetical protein [bacterium]
MKKIITLLLLLICISFSFSQSKKKQIEILTSKLDSINSVLLSSTDDNEKLSDTKLHLESKISSLNSKIGSKNDEISLKNEKIESLIKEVKSLEKDYQLVVAELELKSDSLDSCVYVLLNKNISENNKNPNEIYFEGIVVFILTPYDNIEYIEVKIDKGELAGKTEELYWSCGTSDTNTIESTGDFDVRYADEGKKVAGVIVRSNCMSENYETGVDYSKEIYRVKVLNNAGN